ncbi:hypothetical protein GQ55_3G446600 [Panicum hallii var. hallii]|uniref:Uncharacterized protein n=1 Tax=Panicum hallii var. hallii TaxID=1504633 RepID=A0A2T7EIC5_9POAL|nr:hypothetical protein GQ55_3G446600 [Panicum hallii var. hallii]PUZ67569.1 hypothetical protein GQ55_3G446600 [Panicum hallii var. hallii]
MEKAVLEGGARQRAAQPTGAATSHGGVRPRRATLAAHGGSLAQQPGGRGQGLGARRAKHGSRARRPARCDGRSRQQGAPAGLLWRQRAATRRGARRVRGPGTQGRERWRVWRR